jgi:hypothetical protein
LKHYLLRVGADKDKGGGFVSPIFEDMTYRFIPIPDDKNDLILDSAITYSDYRWQNKSIVSFLPARMSPDHFIHNDPEFTTFTYGSPKYRADGVKEKNYDALLRIDRGDILTFYAAFSSSDIKMNGLYFFAYFVVETIVHWGSIDDLSEYDQSLIRNNHHFIHRRQDQVVVVGSSNSRLFEKAVLLSSSKEDFKEKNYYPCKSIKENTGYEKAMNMSSLRCLPSDRACKFKEYLDVHSVR